MKISSSCEYGLRLMVHLARHHGRPPIPAEKLAEAGNIPRDYVDQILLRLRRAGLVTSQRGANGGYALASTPDRVSVADVLKAVEGRVFGEVCDKYATGDHDCRRQSDCGLRSVWMRLSLMIEDFLGKIPLSELMAPEDKVYALLSEAAAASEKAAERPASRRA